MAKTKKPAKKKPAAKKPTTADPKGPAQASFKGMNIPGLEKASEAYYAKVQNRLDLQLDERALKAALDAVIDAQIKKGVLKDAEAGAGEQVVYRYTGDDFKGGTRAREVYRTCNASTSVRNAKQKDA